MKFGRNDPCPCGSGKKYKHCCLLTPSRQFSLGDAEKILLESTGCDSLGQLDEALKHYGRALHGPDVDPGPEAAWSGKTFNEFREKPNQATAALKNLQDYLSRQPISSPADIDRLTMQYNEMRNRRPIPEFLGLSPAQMHALLDGETEDGMVQDVVTIAEELDPVMVQAAPIMRQIRSLIAIYRENAGKLELTSAGRFRPEMVKRWYDENFAAEPGREILDREIDTSELSLIHRLLISCGLIQESRTRSYLNYERAAELEKGSGVTDLYEEVLFWLLFEYDWMLSIRDDFRFDAFRFIWNSRFFSFYLLHRLARSPVTGETLSKAFIRAFPDLLHGSGDQKFHTMLLEIIYCDLMFSTIGFELGLVEPCSGIDETNPQLPARTHRKIRVTPLFDQVFSWHPG